MANTNNEIMPKRENFNADAGWFSLFSEFDVFLFKSGKHFRLFEKFGAHEVEHNGQKGTFFAVWAPNAESVSVIGNFNGWDYESSQLCPRWDESGIWEVFLPNIGHGELYKYVITTKEGHKLEKGDPFARFWEGAPKNASIVWSTDYKWQDAGWWAQGKKKNTLHEPVSVYEVHLGSWKKKLDEEGGDSLSYKELAQELVAYVKDMGFTHVEFMPIMEYPFYGSWGYQITGYFAPTWRFGTPEEFMGLVDAFHNEGIGVILDWVPSHFPEDAHGLHKFDGTYLYEHEDPKKGFHPDWNSYIFNYDRNEVRSFLISNALFWLEMYHVDGLRVDAVASMLYLDYSRKEGEWIPNEYGGNENLGAVSFLKELNEVLYSEFPDVLMVAEESTSWSGVSRPTYMGGLGFGQKWMMGWMHDTLEYFTKEPIHRSHHQNAITFSIMYAFSENFMLPLSHDEVVHGKGSLISRMPGDEWQQFANMRLLYGYMYTHPGTKLLFMGGEFGQTSEWKYEQSLDWYLLQYDVHNTLQNFVRDLNRLYKNLPALYEFGFEQKGFQWIDYGDNENSVLTYLRQGASNENTNIVLCNFTPVVRSPYRVGVPFKVKWQEVLNSDDLKYGGSGVLNIGIIESEEYEYHGRPYSINISLPPLGIVVLGISEY